MIGSFHLTSYKLGQIRTAEKKLGEAGSRWVGELVSTHMWAAVESHISAIVKRTKFEYIAILEDVTQSVHRAYILIII